MCKDLKSELTKITLNYMELVSKTSGKASSSELKSKTVMHQFYQLVDDLLDRTSEYMKKNGIQDSDEYTVAVQTELERFFRNIN